MNAFKVGDTVYFPAREFPNDHYANYADYFWFGRVSSSRGGMHTVRTNNCATEYLYHDGALLDWEREYNEARAVAAGCPSARPRAHQPHSPLPPSRSPRASAARRC